MAQDQEQKDKPEYVQDSPFNRKLISVADKYLALLQFQLKDDLDKVKKEAWNIASNSKNPKLKDVCRELDKLEIS